MSYTVYMMKNGKTSMSKITRFDRPVVVQFRSDFQKDLDVLSQKYGLKIALGNAKFTSENVSFKLEVAVVGKAGALTREATAFKSMARMYDLSPDLLGKKILLKSGKLVVVEGLNPRCHKYPVIVRLPNAKRMKVSVLGIKTSVPM